MIKKTPAVSVKIDIWTLQGDMVYLGGIKNIQQAAGGYVSGLYILLRAECTLKESTWARATGYRPQRDMELVRGCS